MIYLNINYPQLTKKKCYRCSSFLILTEVTVEKVPGQHSAITTSIYKCSNSECQEKADKEIARMKKQREHQDQMRTERARLRSRKTTVSQSET